MPNILGSIQKTFSGTSLVAQMAETSAYNAGNLGLIPGLGRSPGEGNGSLLQYCCLENTMDRGAWQAAVHGVARSQATITVLVRVKFDAQRTVLHRNMEC